MKTIAIISQKGGAGKFWARFPPFFEARWRTADRAAAKEMAVTAQFKLKAETDPTFAAIELHRLRLTDITRIDDITNRAAFDAACTPEERAADDLCCTPPTTIAGARAAIQHIMAAEDGQGVPARAPISNASWPRRSSARQVNARIRK